MSLLIPKRRWLRKPEGTRVFLNHAHPLARHLAGGWIMSELAGSTVRDLVGAGGHDGTITGSNISRTRTRFGAALDGSGSGGSDHRVDLGSIAPGDRLMLDGDHATWIWRARLTGNPGGASRIIDKSDSGFAANGWAIWWDHNNNSYDLAANGDNPAYEGPTGLSQDVWYNPAVTKEGTSSVKWYLDPGTGLNNEITTSIEAIPTATTNAAIANWNHTTSRDWVGQIEYVFVFDRVLTYREIEWVRANPYALIGPTRTPAYYLPMFDATGTPVTSTMRTPVVCVITS